MFPDLNVVCIYHLPKSATCSAHQILIDVFSYRETQSNELLTAVSCFICTLQFVRHLAAAIKSHGESATLGVV